MLPMLLRPSRAAPRFVTMGYTRLWAATSKSGSVTGSALSDTGKYEVKWWDGTTSAYNNGDTFAKSGSGSRAFEVYPTEVITPNVSGSPAALVGLAEISASQSRFGGSSAKFSHYGDLIAGNVTFNWNANWTLELWLNRSSSGFGQVATVFQAGGIQGGVGGLHISTLQDGSVEFSDAATGGIYDGFTPLGQWVHLAAVRNNGTNTLYIDGVSVGTSTVTFPVGNTSFSIGGVSSYGFFTDGYIDEFRLTQSALYSGASFTPPTTALSAISGTAILLHFDTSSSAPFGQFDAFNVSGNEISKLRAEAVSLSSSPGYYQGGYWNWTNHTFVQGPYVPGVMEQGNLSTNSLNAASLDQFYSDLLSGTGALYVAGNPGISADDPTIATGKGYTVYGSVPP
jgi:hypothetical protein